jgi:hypothetical protein
MELAKIVKAIQERTKQEKLVLQILAQRPKFKILMELAKIVKALVELMKQEKHVPQIPAQQLKF